MTMQHLHFTHTDRIVDFPRHNGAALIGMLREGSPEDQLARLDRLFGEIAPSPTPVKAPNGYNVHFADGAELMFCLPYSDVPELHCITRADTLERAVELNSRAMGRLLAIALTQFGMA